MKASDWLALPNRPLPKRAAPLYRFGVPIYIYPRHHLLVCPSQSVSVAPARYSPGLGDATAAAASTPRRSNRIRVEMGTEFEDENAKEKLKAMLNRQFGIGDVGFTFSRDKGVFSLLCFLRLVLSIVGHLHFVVLELRVQ